MRTVNYIIRNTLWQKQAGSVLNPEIFLPMEDEETERVAPDHPSTWRHQRSNEERA